MPDRVHPHLLGEGHLCYLEATSTVLDRYEPGGTALFCLHRAGRVLRDAILGKSDEDFAAEFFAYWGGTAYVDLPKEFEAGDAAVHWLALRPEEPEMRTGVIAPKGRLRDDGVPNAVPRCKMYDRDAGDLSQAALDGGGARRFEVGEQNLQHDRRYQLFRALPREREASTMPLAPGAPLTG
jgi:hypothetical protein